MLSHFFCVVEALVHSRSFLSGCYSCFWNIFISIYSADFLDKIFFAADIKALKWHSDCVSQGVAGHASHTDDVFKALALFKRFNHHLSRTPISFRMRDHTISQIQAAVAHSLWHLGPRHVLNALILRNVLGHLLAVR